MADAERKTTFREVFRLAEFRAVWVADLLSVAGDQVTRVALAVLVYAKTGSAALTALTYALTFLPALAGPLLGGFADRYSRRNVMIVTNSARAVLVAVMAIPDLPLPALYALLIVVQLMAAPHDAARGALLADILDGDRLVVGNSARNVTNQLAQMAGFAFGGGLAALINPHVALLVDAASFTLAALLVAVGVRSRPAAATAGSDGPSLWQSTRQGLRLVAGDGRLRVLAVLAWMIGLSVVPEGLAVPYAAEIGASPAAVGLLLAADPLGMAIGAFVLGRFVRPERRVRLMGPLAAAAGIPLLVCATKPDLILSMALFALCGACAAYLVVVGAVWARIVPDRMLGQAMSLYLSGILASQGIAIALTGLLAARIGSADTIAVTGVVCLVIGLGAALAWRRNDSPAKSPNEAA
ncbi:MFS transporter [Kibdelosporangium aridum]|uniref:MFS transporter n=1 Tax=Kibdelosporangium aridum TaxID=2030 RepID=A0A428YYF6_KIBAR|nr:MFS transporter [Kibdelosporangium aridum]RSM75862.1 MFS transporter [Kibdelosporangium aridum]